MRLPFDAHNHVHLGSSSALSSLLSGGILQGMAIMSTHPQDFEQVSRLAGKVATSSINNGTQREEERDPSCAMKHIIPCFGVHPWFLGGDSTNPPLESNWIENLTYHLETTPNSIVGEIGLDGFHFCPKTKELVAPMDYQVDVFEQQMILASQLKKPVSLHAVQCWGVLSQSLAKLKRQKTFPSSIYFHAFGGKAGTLDQMLALCKQANCTPYFGFAPCVNFRLPKTSILIEKIGIDRLLLESDREDASKVNEDMEASIQVISEVLDLDKATIIEQTNINAQRFYGF
mmetsp:Transcript_8071/g.11572  ORF Transcript_8071/g.11572 Transcript_8071/m.11572 type:complete len:287 (+) Transcript_8071:301-1161(+)